METGRDQGELHPPADNERRRRDNDPNAPWNRPIRPPAPAPRVDPDGALQTPVPGAASPGIHTASAGTDPEGGPTAGQSAPAPKVTVTGPPPFTHRVTPNPIQRVLFMFAGVNLKAAEKAPSEWRRLSIGGIVVLIPALQALLGGAYLVSDVIANPPWWAAALAGLFFATVVMVIDRSFLVMHHDLGWAGTTARVVFSVCLAFIIGEPITNIVFEPQINEQLVNERKELVETYSEERGNSAPVDNQTSIDTLKVRLAERQTTRTETSAFAQKTLEEVFALLQVANPTMNQAELDALARQDSKYVPLHDSIVSLDQEVAELQDQIKSLEDQHIAVVDTGNACTDFAEAHVSDLDAVDVPPSLRDTCDFDTYGIRFDGVTGILVKFKALFSYSLKNPSTLIPMLLIRFTIFMIDLLVVLMAGSITRRNGPYYEATVAQSELESERLRIDREDEKDKLRDRFDIQQHARQVTTSRMRTRIRALQDAANFAPPQVDLRESSGRS